MGFVHPLLGVGLVVLYYLSKIIQDTCDSKESIDYVGMNSFSDDVVEEMR